MSSARNSDLSPADDNDGIASAGANGPRRDDRWRRLLWDAPNVARRPMTFAPESRFNRPTVAEVNLDALLHNLGQIRALAPGASVLAVVKANAYGHGAVQVARALEPAGVAAFGVSLVEEGVDLRRAGVEADILVLGAAYSDYAEESSPTGWSRWSLPPSTSRGCSRRPGGRGAP